MRIDILSVFPGLFPAFLETSFVGIAREQGVLEVRIHDLRDWTRDRHRSVDDAPFGGGPGMVMKPEPLVEAIEALAGAKGPGRRARVSLLSPQGRRLDQAMLGEAAGLEHWLLVCGRYEGVDQRAIELAVDDEISIRDFVLSGGEVPAMVLIEGVARLLPGVLGNPESLCRESFQDQRLEGPQYTRPAEFRGHAVPRVLRSGDHEAVARWREERALAATRSRRPDLLAEAPEPPGAQAAQAARMAKAVRTAAQRPEAPGTAKTAESAESAESTESAETTGTKRAAGAARAGANARKDR